MKELHYKEAYLTLFAHVSAAIEKIEQGGDETAPRFILALLKGAQSAAEERAVE